jgi:hypothetical protein
MQNSLLCNNCQYLCVLLAQTQTRAVLTTHPRAAIRNSNAYAIGTFSVKIFGRFHKSLQIKALLFASREFCEVHHRSLCQSRYSRPLIAPFVMRGGGTDISSFDQPVPDGDQGQFGLIRHAQLLFDVVEMRAHGRG